MEQDQCLVPAVTTRPFSRLILGSSPLSAACETQFFYEALWAYVGLRGLCLPWASPSAGLPCPAQQQAAPADCLAQHQPTGPPSPAPATAPT